MKRNEPGWMIRRRRNPRIATGCAALVLLLAGPAWAGPNAEQALRRLSEGDAVGARRAYEDLLAKSPSDARLAFNAGVAAHQMGDWESAGRHHETALKSPDISLQQRAFFGLGSARFRQGEATEDVAEKTRMWEESARNYQAAVGLNPADTDARANLEAVREQLAKLGREQRPQPGPKDPQQQQKRKPEDKDPKEEPGEGSNPDQQGKEQANRKDAGTEQDPKDGEGKQQGKDPKQDSQGGAKSPGDGSKDERGDNQGGRMEGKKDGAPKGDEPAHGREGQQRDATPRAAGQPGKEDGEAGQHGSHGPAPHGEEAAEGRMALRFAERLLDSHKREERALIWSVPRSMQPDSRSQGRKTW